MVGMTGVAFGAGDVHDLRIPNLTSTIVEVLSICMFSLLLRVFYVFIDVVL